MQNDTTQLTVAGLLRSPWQGILAAAPDHNYAQLWSAFSQAAREASVCDPESEAVLSFLARICSLRLSVEPRPNPFGVLLATSEGRTMSTTDILAEEVDFLPEVVKHVDDYRVRARAADLLWILGDRSQRARYAGIAIDNYKMWPLNADKWSSDGRAAWSRAADLSKRLGRATRMQLASLETEVLESLLNGDEGVQLLQLGELLLAHRLAAESAKQIAEKYEVVALKLGGQENLRRRYLILAQSWYVRAGDRQKAAAIVRGQVDSWIREAESRRAGANPSNLVAASFYESALQTYRQLSRAERQTLDVESLGDELADLARACGLLGLAEMEAIQTEPVDLAEVARDSIKRVAKKDAGSALLEYVSLAGLRSFQKDKAFAEQLIREHPLSTLFPSVHYSRDGRVVHRTGNGDKTYGIEAPVWTQMVQAFEINIRLLVQGAILPAYHQLSSEHVLSLTDFQNVAAGSSIVPRERIMTVARGLLHGYNGDFVSAMYLLTPQVEHFVRQALREAGAGTSTIDQAGVENEIGLTALMQTEEAVSILGEDLAYELRALFCGPVGPNIRNLAAHGLIDDSAHSSADVIYTWWFVLRLLYSFYWNRLRGKAASDT